MIKHHLKYSALILSIVLLSTEVLAKREASEPGNKRLPSQYRNIDMSPAPNYTGNFVSLGQKQWRKPAPAYFGASADTQVKNEPARNCSTKAIVYYATQAPNKFQAEKNGLLYGVKTHTPATRVDNMPGYNSCALVVYAIMKKAGCNWMRKTTSAKAIYDSAYRHGWKPSLVQKAGCIVAWNAKSPGAYPRIGQGVHRKKGQSKKVAYRHVGITTGAWMSMDNTSIFSKPSSFITTRPIRYEAPIFLCPSRKVKIKSPK